MAGGYWTGAHTTHRLRFHLVFVPKYRRRILEQAVAARLVELLRQACEVRAWGLVELNVQPDHVHLLLQVTPCECLADAMQILMQILKGGTARVLRGFCASSSRNWKSFCGATASGRKAILLRQWASRKKRVCVRTSATRKQLGRRHRKRGTRNVLNDHKKLEPFMYESCSRPRVSTCGIFTPWLLTALLC